MTSGTTLTLRKLRPSTLDGKELRSFFSLYMVEVFLSLFFFSILIFSYSSFKNDIPLNLLLGVYLYFFVSGLHLMGVELLLAFNRFRASGLLDVASILIQIVIFLALYQRNVFSIANTLLVSFSSSYLFILVLALGYLRFQVGLRIGFSRPNYFYSLTKGHHSIGISIGIMDRLDRLLIGFFLPTNVLGRYAVMSGMLSVFRFVPDSISKLLVSRNLSMANIFYRRKIQIGMVFVILVAILSISTNVIIEFILGEGWLLPLGVTVFFIAQECLRSAFQIQANRRIVQGFAKAVHRQAISIPVVSIIFSLTLIPFLGIYGVSLSISIAFISSLVFLDKIGSK